MLPRVAERQIRCDKQDTSGEWVTAQKKLAIFAHWNGQCWACGISLQRAGCAFDHVVDGPHTGCHHSGCNRTWNIAPVCNNCNIGKGNMVGNWVHFIDHAALAMMHNGDTRELSVISQSIMERIENTLYRPVVGYEGDFNYFIGIAAHKAAYSITRTGSSQKPIFTTRTEVE